VVKLPGVRSRIKSGVKNPPQNFPYGNILIIDTGKYPGCTGGAGINGTVVNGKDAIYEGNTIEEYRSLVKYGMPWLLGQPLFKPTKSGAKGISKFFYVSARSSTPASATITFTGDNDGSTSIVNGGVFSIRAKDEGLAGNGVLVNGNLTKGYGFKMFRGTIDPTKFTLVFFVGTYKGLDQNGLAFDNVSEDLSVPTAIAKSVEFNNAATLKTWMQTNAEFKEFFDLVSATVDGDGTVDDADFSDYNTTYNLLSGGTESYAGTTHLNDVIEATKDLVINFVFTDITEASQTTLSAANATLLDAVKTKFKYKPELYISAGSTKDHFANSKTLAIATNSELGTVVHGGSKKNTQRGEKLYGAIYTGAAFLGREAGLPPQVPLTFKDIDVDGLVHNMNEKEQTQSLDAGLLVAIAQDGGFEVLKGVNSLQANTFLQNEDGTTHSKQLRRIARQLNMEIAIQARIDLLKNPNGPNRATLSTDIVATWLEGFLKRKKVKPGIDNLILFFQNIKVTRNQDALFISYEYGPNSEISFLFFTGTTLDV
jgi:hypothetical protein